MLNYALDLTFFHELGHFVAARLNAQHFGGPPALAVELFPDAYEGRNGETRTAIPRYYHPKEPEFLDRLPMHLASLVYGCYFQSYSLGWKSLPTAAHVVHTQYERCYDFMGQGKDDMAARYKVLSYAGQDFNLEAFSRVENAYFERLIAERELDPFMTLNREAYFLDRRPMTADLDRLAQDCAPLIDGHSHSYLDFVGDLRSCLDQGIA